MNNIFPQKLRVLREAQNITQAQIAEEINVSLNTYAHYERQRKRPSLKTFASLCLALNVSAEQLLFEGTFKTSLTEEQRVYLRTLDSRQLSVMLNLLQTIYDSQKEDM